MIIKKITMFAVMMAAAVIIAAPTVTDVVAKQRYPWNGLVDITCMVSGIEGTTNGLKFAVAAVSQDPGDARKCSNFWVMQNGDKTIDRKVHTNGNYRLLWDAGADLGTGIYGNMVVRVTIRSAPDSVQLWEGGPYWAETNIGADEPWEYGYYFWWGDTVGYKRENDKWVASDGSLSNYSFRTADTPTYDKTTDTLQSEGWITADGVLAPEHDAAHVHWGGDWRMPTYQELSDLNGKCDWTWTTQNGVNGYVVRGRGAYADNSIFLPAAGRSSGTALFDSGSDGTYWSSVPRPDDVFYSRNLYFDSFSCGTSDHYGRYLGRSVRPVQGFAQ